VEHRQIVERVRAARRVRVVDDHASFRSSVRPPLRSEGFDVVGEAADGESAVGSAAELEPELVLLHIQLPDIDVFAVAERLLTHDRELQIVVVSTHDRSSYGPKIKQSGTGFVVKADLSGAGLERLLE
jgi:DNA-binding NarL/FixJ family response regulator